MIFGTPEQAGWKRRPDIDDDEVIYWELPNGFFAGVARGQFPIVALSDDALAAIADEAATNEDDAP